MDAKSFDFSFLYQHGRLMFSTAMGIVATGATFVQNLSTLFGQQNLASKIKVERARATETLDFLAKFSGDDKERNALRQALEKDLADTLRRIKTLTGQLSDWRENPNHDLGLWQSFLLFFSPESGRVCMTQILAWLCMVTLPFCVLAGSSHRSEAWADLVVLASYGALVFRAWALAERKWFYGYKHQSSVWRNMLVLKRPANHSMMTAQVFLWVCVYCAIAAVEDFIFDFKNSEIQSTPAAGKITPTEVILMMLVPLLGAFACRWLAAAELKRSLALPATRLRLTISARAWIISAGVAGFVVAYLGLQVVHEVQHRIFLLGEWAIIMFAIIRQSILKLQFGPRSTDSEASVKMRSMAA